MTIRSNTTGARIIPSEATGNGSASIPYVHSLHMRLCRPDRNERTGHLLYQQIGSGDAHGSVPLSGSGFHRDGFDALMFGVPRLSSGRNPLIRRPVASDSCAPASSDPFLHCRCPVPEDRDDVSRRHDGYHCQPLHHGSPPGCDCSWRHRQCRPACAVSLPQSVVARACGRTGHSRGDQRALRQSHHDCAESDLPWAGWVKPTSETVSTT